MDHNYSNCIPITVHNIRNPIFILGSHKSGSSLLRALIDDHPDVYIVPKESHFFQFAGAWVDYALRRNYPAIQTDQEWIERMTEYAREQNKSDNRYADACGIKEFDIDRFRQRITSAVLSRPKSSNYAGLFEHYIGAIHYALTSTDLPTHRRVVEKSVEHAEFAYVLRELFPGSRFVHIIRNPYATLVALRRSRSRGGFPSLIHPVQALYNSYCHLFKNKLALNNYYVVRYEDILKDPQTAMTGVAKAIDVPFHPTLLKPTQMGRPWSGNSTSDQAFTDISQAPLENWKPHLTHLEVHLINRIAHPVLQHYEYCQQIPDSSEWKPVWGEGLKTYLKNRSLFLSFSP